MPFIYTVENQLKISLKATVLSSTSTAVSMPLYSTLLIIDKHP